MRVQLAWAVWVCVFKCVWEGIVRGAALPVHVRGPPPRGAVRVYTCGRVRLGRGGGWEHWVAPSGALAVPMWIPAPLRVCWWCML
jgi:hypothetical protein